MTDTQSEKLIFIFDVLAETRSGSIRIRTGVNGSQSRKYTRLAHRPLYPTMRN